MPFNAANLIDNPVLTRELRVRMRGARAYWILAGYIGMLAVLVLIRYYNFWSDTQAMGSGGSNAAEVGHELFLWIALPQIFLVFFITPAITSGAITIEREQQTLDLLVMTHVAKRTIITGKLLSAVAFSALLIISSVPLMSICFMLGGTAPVQIFTFYMEMIAGSVTIGAMGLMWSSVAKSTTYAVIATYATLFVLMLVVLIVPSVSRSNGTGTASLVILSFEQTLTGNYFLGYKLVDGVGLAALCTIFGVLMAAMATARLETYPERKGYIPRILTLLMVLIPFTSMAAWWYDAWYNKRFAAAGLNALPPIGCMCLPAGMIMLLTPIFSTGSLEPEQARQFFRSLLRGWKPSALRYGSLTSAPAFLAWLVLASAALYVGVFAAKGSAKSAFRSGGLALGQPGQPPPAPLVIPCKPGEACSAQGSTVTVAHPDGSSEAASVVPNGQVQVLKTFTNGRSSITFMRAWPANIPRLPVIPPQGPPPPTGDLVQGIVSLVAAILGFSLFCMSLTALFRTRWLAMLAAYVLVFTTSLAPEIALQTNRGGTTLSAWINLFYLNPMEPFVQICEPASYWDQRTLLFGLTPMWLGVTIVWCAIGVVSLILLLFCTRQIARSADSAIEYLPATPVKAARRSVRPTQ